MLICVVKPAGRSVVFHWRRWCVTDDNQPFNDWRHLVRLSFWWRGEKKGSQRQILKHVSFFFHLLTLMRTHTHKQKSKGKMKRWLVTSLTALFLLFELITSQEIKKCTSVCQRRLHCHKLMEQFIEWRQNAIKQQHWWCFYTQYSLFQHISE